MSFITENWTLIALVLASGAMLMWPAMSAGGGKNSLNANEAVQLMNREKAVIVDVCNARFANVEKSRAPPESKSELGAAISPK